jgi:hypothetical protein
MRTLVVAAVGIVGIVWGTPCRRARGDEIRPA